MMSTEQKVQRLEDLLERVRRNAGVPRTAVPAVVAAPAHAREELPAEDELVPVEPAPVAEPEAELELLDVELLDEDVVEITMDESLPAEEPLEATTDLEPIAAQSGALAPVDSDLVGLDFEEEEIEPPASSRRPKVAAASMDEALTTAAARIGMDDEEREPPLKTPPPESGRQLAGPPSGRLEPAPVPEGSEAAVDREPEEFVPAFAAASGPTPEQLGATIELEEAPGPALELDPPPPVEPTPPVDRIDELEAPVPESEAPLALREAVVAPAPEPLAVAAPTELQPEVTQRAPLAAVPVARFAGERRAFVPSRFVDLLDASLKL